MRYLLLIFTFLTSCLSPKHTAITQYDIKPQYNSTAIDFRMESVKLEGPYSTKMAFVRGAKIEEKEYLRWSASPHTMLHRYWMLKPKTPSPKILKGVVRVFEFNLDKNTAEIVFDYKENDQWHQLIVQEKFADADMESFVSAMQKAVATLTGKISKK